KGYEFAKDQYVMFSPEELKAMEEVGTHSADITEFVPLKTVDPVYFDKAYYLGPDKGGAKPYALLARALRESGRCALGRWAARGKQYIVMIRPVEDLVDGLVMQQLIEQQSSDKFDPSQYADEVRARIEAAVEKKVQGQEITAATEPQAGAEVIDLMEALRASLEKKPAKKAQSEKLQSEKPATRK